MGSWPALVALVLVLRGAAIYTLDPARPWASALVIKDSQIVYVGDDMGAKSYLGPGARAVALDGKMIVPGFHDSHCHPMMGGMRLLRCQLEEAKSPRELDAAVRACAARQRGPWLVGGGWSQKAFGAGGPTLAKLDELVPDRPAYLANEDGFIAWINSKALASAGLRQAAGIVEGESLGLVRRKIPQPSQAEYREALRRATAMANRFGITSLADARASEAVVEAYRAADLAGELTVRVMAAQAIDTGRGPEQVDELIARRRRARGKRFRAEGAKIFLDGDIEKRTAALIESYRNAPGFRGQPFVEPDALSRLVRSLDAEGFLIHLHALGDRAVRLGLDAIEQAMEANGPRDRRHQIAHLGVVDPADLRRFGELGVIADFQPIWAQAGDAALLPTEAALGPQRSRFIYPLAGIAAAGGRLVAGSDWPSPSMDPLQAMQVALTRQPLDGSQPAHQPEQRIGLAAILAAYTIDGAFAAREESIDGSLKEGKAADLVVLERNLFEVPVTELHKVRVLLTLLDGVPVYRAEEFAWPQ